MKKIRLLALILCMIAATACFFACGNQNSESAGSTDGENTIKMSEIGLDLFEDKELTLPESVSGVAVWASADETIVTVKDGVVSAMGQNEGLAEVSATVGDISVIYPIRVTDTGDRPFLTADAFSVYKGKTADIKEHLTLTYKDADITEGVTYTYNPVGNQVTVAEDGTVSGVAAGMTKIQVRATYKGFTTATKAVSVTIEESDIVKPLKDKVSLSILEGDVDPTSYEIEAEVFVNAEKVENATIVASIEEGEEIVELDGLTVTAKAIGKAVILLTYNGEVTVTGTIEITVHDDTVEYNAGALMSPNVNSTFNKVFEGEFADCYEYTLGTTGNYWDNAVISSTLDSIPNNGYKTFSYEIYFADSASLVVYIPSAFQSGSGAYCMYDLSTTGNKFNASLMGKYTGDDDLLHIYGADGQRLADGTELVTGQWYTIVYDVSTYTDGWSMMGFSINTTANGQKAYLRNFAYHTTANLLPNGTYDERHPIGEVEDPEVTDEKDDFLNKLIIGSKAVSVKKVANGDFAGSYKIRSQTTASSGTISFGDIHNNVFEPQEFFTKGYHYIKFDIYIASGNGLGICNWIKGVDGKADVKLETTITPDVTAHDTVRIYNERGNLSALKQGGWYTVLVDVPYDDNNLPEWDLFYIGLPGSKYVPAIGYIRNIEYLKTDPEIVGDDSNIAKMVSRGTIEKQTGEIDGVAEAYLYTNKSNSFYEDVIGFETGTPITKGKLVRLKAKLNGSATVNYSINWVNSVQRNDWTFDDNIRYYTINGKKLSGLSSDEWRYIVIDLIGSENWVNFICVNPGESMYIADLELLDESPYPEETNIDKLIIKGTVERQTGEIDGVANAYLYTNKSGSFYEDAIGFDTVATVTKGKLTRFKAKLNGTASVNYSINWVNSVERNGWTFDNNIKYYTIGGEKVSGLSSDEWRYVVINLIGTTNWLNYICVNPNESMYIADLEVLDENPYPEETNIDKWVITGTVERQTEEINGVKDAYLYTNTSGSFYGDVIGFDTNTTVTKGKLIRLKAKLNGSATVNYSINWGNSIQKNNGWAFDNNIKYYTIGGENISGLSADEWRYIVIDLTGSENWLNYICVNPNESMYIADLELLDENPYVEDTTNIAKYLTTAATLTKQKEAIDGVEEAYLYTSTHWYGSILDFGQNNSLVKGKVITLKVRMSAVSTIFFAVNYVNSYDSGAAWTFDDNIKYYNSDNEAVDTLEADTWYTVVVDLSGTDNWLWYYTLEAGNSMYIADLQILDQNPYTQNA